jgi:hypothetical protein
LGILADWLEEHNQEAASQKVRNVYLTPLGTKYYEPKEVEA